jgi:hypothetical protein
VAVQGDPHSDGGHRRRTSQLRGREANNRRLAAQVGCAVKKDDASIEWRHTPSPTPGGAPLLQRLRVEHDDCYSIWDMHFGAEDWVRSPRPSGRWTIEEVEAWLAARVPNEPCPSRWGRRRCIALGGLGHAGRHKWARATEAQSS